MSTPDELYAAFLDGAEDYDQRIEILGLLQELSSSASASDKLLTETEAWLVDDIVPEDLKDLLMTYARRVLANALSEQRLLQRVAACTNTGVAARLRTIPNTALTYEQANAREYAIAVLNGDDPHS